MTWPLVLGISRDVPGDLGDPLLNLWILGWGVEQLPKLLTGEIALADYWNANIFHPEPLALAFSEHLTGQVLQILPLSLASSNLILAYNLLFLTSFALSGFGMFLLVRDILAEDLDARHATAAAFVSGLVYAFVPFRVAQLAHIQSLSSQWMPLALYGLRVFIRSGRPAALVGGSAALLVQNLSCGYYLIFFAPFLPLWVVHQMWTAGRLRDWRRWAAIGGAAAIVAAATWPFLALYLESQRVHGFERPRAEVVQFSADVYSYFTAPEALWLWGGALRAFAKSEGELFPGAVPLALSAIALIVLVRRLPPPVAPSDAVRRYVCRLLLVVIVVEVAAFTLIVFTGGFITSIAGVPLRATNASRILSTAALAFALLLAASSSARQRLLAAARSPVMLAAVFALFAVWMSLGPVPHTRGQLLQVAAPYAFFYEHVPGFEGLRVPARYAMIAALFLSIVAGAGAGALIAGRYWRAVTATLAIVFLVEAAFLPLPLNLTWGDQATLPPARIEPPGSAPALYRHIATMPDVEVVAEFPFGDLAWELRYVYYSTVHWKRLLNGYSGVFPPGYKARSALLERPTTYPDEAWRALRAAGTTHVIVHEGAFRPGEAAAVIKWLDDHFAVEIARFGDDRLYDVDGVFDHAAKPVEPREGTP